MTRLVSAGRLCELHKPDWLNKTDVHAPYFSVLDRSYSLKTRSDELVGKHYLSFKWIRAGNRFGVSCAIASSAG